jgi:deferrochelatase/peroxidase EfeB
MTKSKKKTRRKATEDAGTARLVLRLPQSIGDSLELGPRNQRDFSPLREVLDRWAKKAKPIEVVSDPSKQVCFHVNASTEDALWKEAERLTEETGQVWTVSMVVARLWAENG